MDTAKYLELTSKREHKIKPRNTPLPKAKQNYLIFFTLVLNCLYLAQSNNFIIL